MANHRPLTPIVDLLGNHTAEATIKLNLAELRLLHNSLCGAQENTGADALLNKLTGAMDGLITERHFERFGYRALCVKCESTDEVRTAFLFPHTPPIYYGSNGLTITGACTEKAMAVVREHLSTHGIELPEQTTVSQTDKHANLELAV